MSNLTGTLFMQGLLRQERDLARKRQQDQQSQDRALQVMGDVSAFRENREKAGLDIASKRAALQQRLGKDRPEFGSAAQQESGDLGFDESLLGQKEAQERAEAEAAMKELERQQQMRLEKTKGQQRIDETALKGEYGLEIAKIRAAAQRYGARMGAGSQQERNPLEDAIKRFGAAAQSVRNLGIRLQGEYNPEYAQHLQRADEIDHWLLKADMARRQGNEVESWRALQQLTALLPEQGQVAPQGAAPQSGVDEADVDDILGE